MMQNNHHSLPKVYEDNVNLYTYWRIIWHYKKSILAIVAASSIAVVATTLLMTNIYKGEATIIPVSNSNSMTGLSSLISGFSGLASIAGMNLPGASKDSEKFVAILKSRTLTENVIRRTNLMQVLFKNAWDPKQKEWKSDSSPPVMEAAVNSMRSSHVFINVNKKNNTIIISAEFDDPSLASRVANAYVRELQNFVNSNAFTVAKRNRLFVESQLQQNKRELLEAGKEINEFYKKNNVSSVEALVNVSIRPTEMSADLEDEARQYSSIALLENNKVSDMKSDVQDLLAQKTQIERKLSDTEVVKNVPQQVYLSYLVMRRELLSKINALLTTQFEMAKIEEAKEDLAFQVIDWAVPPVYKYKPKRALICLGVFFASIFVAVFIAILREYISRQRSAHNGGIL